jgi:hypothetical protein
VARNQTPFVSCTSLSYTSPFLFLLMHLSLSLYHQDLFRVSFPPPMYLPLSLSPRFISLGSSLHGPSPRSADAWGQGKGRGTPCPNSARGLGKASEAPWLRSGGPRDMPAGLHARARACYLGEAEVPWLSSDCVPAWLQDRAWCVGRGRPMGLHG